MNQISLTECVICYRENCNKIVIHFENRYNVTSLRPLKEMYVKFRACYHKKRLRDDTQTSRDGILSQISLTGCVICYRERKGKIVIQFQMLYHTNEIGNV